MALFESANRQVSLPILKVACSRRGALRVVASRLRFSSNFLDVQEPYLYIENTLSLVENLTNLKNQALRIYFPFRNTLLTGKCQFVGLATIHNVRGLKLTMPAHLVKDEKRNVRRLHQFPPATRLVFSTASLQLFSAFPLDISVGGIGFTLRESGQKEQDALAVGDELHLDLQLEEDFKISCPAEVRHISALPKSSLPSTHHLGVRFQGLGEFAQDRLNQWLFTMAARETEVRPSPRSSAVIQPATLVVRGERNPHGILAIGPDAADLDFLSRTLGRKFELLTSDMNITNVRMALASQPALLLIHIETRDSRLAAFTRKFCMALGSGTPIAFFGSEADEGLQKLAIGSVPNLCYLNIAGHKPLNTFKQIEALMHRLNPP